MNVKSIGLILLLVFLCGISISNVYAASPPAPADKSASASFTDFGFNIYRELLKQSSGKNIFISPTSIAMAISMVYNGAEKDTASAIAAVLKMNGVSIDNTNKQCKSLMNSLKTADPSVELSVANSLWCRKGVPFDEKFIKRVKDSFAAVVSDQMNAAAMNGWVSRNTKGRIQKIIDSVPANAVMYVINAVYFKGQWSARFDKKLTRDLDFHISVDKTKKHPMMSQKGKYLYYKGNTFQAVSLPYGKKRLSMFVFLPDPKSSLKDFHRTLTTSNWNQWMASFSEYDGAVVLPRFKCEYEAELNNSLKSLGMAAAFDPATANFGGISKEKLYISRIKHKTYVDVNEEGTEAAAVTSTEMKMTSVISEQKSFKMTVDRPFFFAIVDTKDNSVLFMGSVTEPGK
ncbi:MAG: serpin family protein [Candidatus Xenobiia bacterium LiM19]